MLTSHRHGPFDRRKAHNAMRSCAALPVSKHQLMLPFSAVSAEAALTDAQNEDALPSSTWSVRVATDPRHRPQTLDRPSSTVRRCWCFSPQEAHLLDAREKRYRRLTIQEIALIQGFDPSWFVDAGLKWTDTVRAIGDAVPPPLARAIVESLNSHVEWTSLTAVEICAGAGGLASASAQIGLEHLLLMDYWEPACCVLRANKPWDSGRVVCGSVAAHDFSSLRQRVGLLSGGPPCQPWSLAGRRRGHDDERDLLRDVHRIVEAVEPDAFVFENVPGLFSVENRRYLSAALARLRSPGRGLRYGVVSGVLNAADYGVPQTRRRVFIVGIRNQPSSAAHRVLDKAALSATHRDPTLPRSGVRPWKTLREAFDGLPDPGGWKRLPG
jgi:site-specific DNA-cytosine methylase